MTDFGVSFVGQTIGKLLINEAQFLWGVKGQVEGLERELKLIEGMLRDADARQEHEQAIGELVAQLRNIAYDAEDIIEQYILRVMPKKEQNIIKEYVNFVVKRKCVQAHEVGTKINGLKTSISILGTRMQGFGIQIIKKGEREHVRASMWKRPHAHFEEEFVGREDNIKELVKELLKDGEQDRVISICGMGGLGKTALAKKVFAHDEVKNHFDGSAWACVSQEYHVRDILEGILIRLIPDKREEVPKKRNDELLETLYMTQKEKRCIVVLDDIWTKQAWDDLRDAFPVKNTRSKLLITTRNREVAEYIYPHGFLHEPQCLSDQESWELLMKRVFPKTERLAVGFCSVKPGVGQDIAAGQPVAGIAGQVETEEQIPVITKDKKRLGDELLKKCGGLPLAIIVLGGLLAVNEWETIYKKINLHFGDKSDVSKVLALSYADLPWHLKPCFLYFGSFPEGAEIPATKVFHMWIAEGFVSPNAYDGKREIQVEDVAEQYLTELVNRGMVQLRFNLSGKLKTCHLHDLMRDLCLSKALQENFLSIPNIWQDNETEDCSSSMAIKVESTCKIRRLTLNMHTIDEGNMFPSIKQIGRTMLHLRTLMFFGSVKGKWKQFEPIFSNCKFLRVLKLEDLSCIEGNLPESVENLVHLRFLSLAGSKLEGLPQSMGNLVFMEFLDLRVTPNVTVSLPNVLWKMRRLRYLVLPFKFVVKKKFRGDWKKLRLGTLNNLQTLKNFSSTMCDVNDVGKLTNLQKITSHGAHKLEIIRQLAKFNLKHLQYSSFSFTSKDDSFTYGELTKMSSYHHFCKLSMSGKIEKFPEHKNLPQQLRKLFLVASKLKEDPMPILEKLDHLVVLLLGYSAFEGNEMVCSAGGFPQLKNLVLYDLPNLEEWRVAKGAMPHLFGLGISKCPKLRAVPEGVRIDDELLKYVDRGIEKWIEGTLLILCMVLGLMLMRRCESSPRVEKKKTKSKGRALDFVLGKTLRGRTGGEEYETSDEGEPANNDVSSLEASDESSINLCEEHETSTERELCNNEISLLEASEESSTNLA